ncbi:unnamed protein product [Angiostrongylus costaricensis]|uniref:Zinc transporter ZIP3 n=1 Tax=Angiostrongylus costaricensis TaxID=334426 RepID=A0A158PHK3_ANGCS|nr:unnamed protein product [Angiostrongylus costaricensis]
MSSTLLQVTLAVVMFVTTAFAGFIPLKLLRFLNKKHGDNKKSGKWLSLLSCFSGGVFMGTCFLDIVPHINENYEDFKVLSGMDIEFPLPQFCTCIGFFLVYLIEEICMKVFSMKHNHGHDSHVEKAKAAPNVHRDSLNLRNLVMEETANYALAEASEGSLLKSLTFAIAMSFHSILEGFALGVQLKAVVTTIIIYAMMTPLGSGLGTLLQTPLHHVQLSNISRLHKDGAVLTLESLAAGTFIYVTFLEVLAQEKDNEHNSLKQLLAIFIGFAVVAALQIAFGGHNHEGGHMQRFANDSLSTVIPH